jgi:hypothetical protein
MDFHRTNVTKVRVSGKLCFGGGPPVVEMRVVARAAQRAAPEYRSTQP